jgi:putative protease
MLPDGAVVIGVRNRVQAGDELEFIGPGLRSSRLRVDELTLLDQSGDFHTAEAANPNQRIVMRPPFAVELFDLIRREQSS